MDYLTMFPETFAAVQRYSPADRCLLYEAMGEFAFSGKEPDWAADDLKWFVWDSLRQRVDATRRVVEQRKQNGALGGRAKRAQANESKSKQTEASESKPKQTEASESKLSSESESESESESKADKEREKERERARQETQERFDRFWRAYPRHTAKQNALKAFSKINPDEDMLAQMLAALERQKQSDQWTRDGGAFVPHPATWLNQERWTDELPKAVPRKTVIAQQYDQRDYSQEPQDDLPPWMMERWKRMQEGGTA